MTDQVNEDTKPLLSERTVVDIGIPGVTLVHFPRVMILPSGLPSDGNWSVTCAEKDLALQRCAFRCFHAAAHFALRLQAIPGALEQIALVASGGEIPPELPKAVRHAEAHAHECDGAYPAGSLIYMENGPSIVDDDGVTRRYMSQAPFVEWEKDGDGNLRCKECGDPAATIWPSES